jgi:ketosteroid isomerase-like protein
METLDKIWSHDESVLIFESGGMDKGWKEYRDHHLAPELKAFKNTKFTVSDAKVKVDGKTGWATYQYALSADYKDRKIESNGLGTMVFEKQEDGKWLIVHSHTSARPKKSN